MKSTAAHALVETLENQRVDRVFCVPGESYLDVLDALRDSSIETVVARQEGGAAMMAEADAKLTGRPGVVFVTRGPGAANASSGVHVAQQDSTPLVLFAGQVARAARGRDAFQELDFAAFYGGMAKSVAEVDDPDGIPDAVADAFHAALSDRPGPAVVSLPEDMLGEPCTAPAKARVAVENGAVDGDLVRAFDVRLQGAQRPLVVVGGAVWRPEDAHALRDFAETAGVPVACVFRRQQLFDHEHPHYAGDIGIGVNPALRGVVEETDLLVLLGTRFSEIPSQSYALPLAHTPVVHVHPDASELQRVHQAELAIQALPGAFLAGSAARGERNAYVQALHASYREWSRLPHTSPGEMTMGKVMATLRDLDDPNMIVTNGAGNYSGWVHRFHRFRRFGNPGRAHIGVHGLRSAGGGCGEAPPPGPNGGVFRGRWMLPDDRSGTRHGGAVRRPCDRAGGRQRHVRHHPHAPGTRVSGSGTRHVAHQSRLCGLGTGLRRVRRTGGA